MRILKNPLLLPIACFALLAAAVATAEESLENICQQAKFCDAAAQPFSDFYLISACLGIGFLIGILLCCIIKSRNKKPPDKDSSKETQQGNTENNNKKNRTHKTAEPEGAEAQFNFGDDHYFGKEVPEDKFKAFHYYFEAAKQEHVEAQFNLGNAYYFGEGTKKNKEQAVHWYRQAAEQGHVEAHFKLGNIYYLSQDEDMSQAFHYHLKAAEQGHAVAQFFLDNIYYFSEGVEEDNFKIFYCYIKAAKQRHVGAQFELGNAYYFGEGTVKDKDRAFHYYLKAAKQEHAVAVAKVTTIFKEYHQAAEQGNIKAQFKLGNAYYFGEGTQKDKSKAVHWYHQAAKSGDAEAQFKLGNAYYFGEGIKKDERKAVYWYCQAAEQGHVEAQFKLGNAYYFGKGIKRDERKAVYWYCQAAERGHAVAQFKLGYFYYSGTWIEQDKSQALHWYYQAAKQRHPGAKTQAEKIADEYHDEAEQGDSKAQFELGNAYYSGKGVTKSKDEAMYWYQKAADRGCSNAEANVTTIINEYYHAAILGHAVAQFQLSDAYYSGKWVEQNKSQALHWCHEAAKQEHSDAKIKILVMINEYCQEAEKGDAKLQLELGHIYYSGKVVKKNEDEAKRWYQKAADQKCPEAQRMCKLIEKKREPYVKTI